MPDTATEVTQERAARLAGAMFLFVNTAGIFAEVFVRGTLLRGDATQAAENIIGSERFFRLGILADVAIFPGGVVLIWSLYILLRSVNRDLALLAVLLRIVEMAVNVTAIIGSLIAVRFLSNAEFLAVFEPGELHALSRMARSVFGFGQDIGFVFLGSGSAVFAYLLLRSRYVPVILAGWGIFASLLLASYNLLIIVFPEAAETFMYMALAPMGLYEIPLGFWLLIKGARINPQSRAATAR